MRQRPAPSPLAAFARPLALTRAGMVVERGLRAFWPALSVLGLIYVALSFRLLTFLPPPWGSTLVSSPLGLAVGYGVWRFRWPRRAEAVARLDATLPGRPLTALTDPLALGGDDPAARALWQAHLARMQRVAEGARAVAPVPDLEPRDPYGLRLTALTAVVIAAVFGAPLTRLAPGAPAPGSAVAAMGPSWEGWAEPPRYTGKPGIYLNSFAGDTLTLPEGTRFAFRFYGRDLPFTESVSSPAAQPQPETAGEVHSRDFEAVQSGVIEIGGPAARRLQVTLLPDAAPSVELVGLAERRADGKLAQPFRAADDYAVVAGHARITLDLATVPRRFGLTVDPEPREDLVYDLPMPFSGSRAEFTEQLIEDAEKHPWANLPVRLTLDVEDGRGQTGTTGAQALELPGRRFFDPRAAALAEMRRDLLWSRANARTTAQLLRAISNRPDEVFPTPEMGAALRLAAQRLDLPEVTAQARDEIAEMLWQMAELLEDGGLSDALAAMQQAQERLSEAMRNGASKDEIAKLMQELKQATDRYLQMLAERGRQEEEGPQFGQQQQQGQQITGDQIQQMMDEIQRLMNEGRMAEAQELLDQLARMMENLKVTQGQGGEGGPGGQAMRDLGQTLREQQELSDQAFRDMQQAPGGQPGQQGDSLADRQQALRGELDRQRGLMPRLGGEAGEEARRQLDEAGRAMEGAEQALRQGDNGTALDQQADAIEALREGMRNMRDAMAQEQGQPSGGEQRQGDATGGQPGRELPRDPLGRATGDGAQFGSERNMLQGEDVYRRARDLLDEIRRRSAERLRPEAELDYLRRLLDRF
ncbi:DUF4175 domain-containing protein [Paenirhodobacter sp.]|uniref:DUF4175 domain-containing protein n=1 Tax=Paenirhodobacter sp. TaxID=1965326 RepID=UPI003B40E5FC